jgi:2'-5' RNA ligase
VLLPDAVRARLARSAAALRERAPELAWVRADNLHLTLRFLGQLDAAALEAARHAARAAAAGVPPFRVAIEGLGGFPTARAARVVWAGVGTGHGALVALHAVLEQALAERGIEPEARPFHPHVTLARARDQRGARGLETALGSGPAFGEFAVSAIHLMRSELAAGGSRYSVLAEAALSDLGAG